MQLVVQELGKNKVVEFKHYLLEKDLKTGTIYRHLNNINRVLTFCPNFTYEEIQQYYGNLREQNCKNTYINSLTCSVRVYAQFKKADDRLQTLKFRKKEAFSKATLSDEEIEAFLKLEPEKLKRRHWRTGKIFYAPANPKLFHRWTIFFSIMAFSGMRPGEVANLTVDDVDFGRHVFVIRDSKTNQPRVAPIAPNILLALLKYLDELYPKQSIEEIKLMVLRETGIEL